MIAREPRLTDTLTLDGGPKDRAQASDFARELPEVSGRQAFLATRKYSMTAGQSGNGAFPKWMNVPANRWAPLLGRSSIRKSPRSRSVW